MAVVVTAVSGYDLGYVWKNQAEQAMPERSAGGYYINAAQAGEPPGRWWGPGAAALGLASGGIVERAPYDQVYQQADPRTGEKLGRARGRYARFADHLAGLLAAEPHATAERRLELERLAAQATRRSPAYTDMTVSFSKSISVFHASVRENERRARLAGDAAAAGWWADAEARFQEVLQSANRAGLEYVQAHAGITRTGYHGRRVDGREPGRFEEGRVVVSSWLQGTSRDGDPQDHVHNQFARMVQTVRDGRWRALDTMCLRGVLGAVQAVVATHVECGLAAEFGIAWVPRADRKGNEIAGISQEQMDAYSTRTQAITARMPAAVASWTARYGRVPNRRELLHIRQAVTMATRDGKEHGPADWDAQAARWDARLGGQLASIAPRVSHPRATHPREGTQPRAESARAAQHAPARADAAARPCAEPARGEMTRAVQQALALVQSAQSTWTRADLIRQLGLVLPPGTRDMAPDSAVRLLDRLADQALSGQAEQVVCLEAPQWPPLPASLIRACDGGSIYTRPGTARYATRVQLSLEEQLLADAARPGAPRLSRAATAALLSSSTATLDTALREGAPGNGPGPAGRGLRADQAAALYHALTCAQTAVVLTGPAGSGKTRVLAEAARLWAQAGRGPVLGIATAQAARNVLAEAGVREAENSSVFLGHLPGARSALGPRTIGAGTLLLIDEASMMSIPDLADIIGHAARHGAKVIVAGDQEQLAAVQAGGGMRLLAGKLGFAQLTEAVRFTCRWEREASLRLRAGDPAVLDAYAEHGRIYTAPPEEAMDLAVRRYVAWFLAGRDVLLMARDHDRCRELSRRIRDDLIHLGLVDGTGREIALAAGARASAGDLIIARANDHDLEAGEPGRTLANGDTLRIDKVRADDTITVRRALDCDQRTGRRQWSRRFAWSGYQDADLAYAVTGHSAQGRTVAAGIGLFTGTEDRHWMYVALSRATEENIAIAFTETGRTADPQAGTRPAPELARHHRIQAERAALSPPQPASMATEAREATAVLADVLARDNADLSATETREQALAAAASLATLDVIWQDQAGPLRRDRYRQAVTAALPAGYPDTVLDTPAAAWLWRTLRAAETAGLDPAQITRDAISSRTLTGARDTAAVIDHRLRQITDPLTPLPPPPWTEQIPATPDPELALFLTRLAAAMDTRKHAIGEHLATSPEPWTIPALGPVPADPLDRLAWQHRAAATGAYRELYSYHDPHEPIGPEPAGDTPDKRARWHEASTALTSHHDIRALPDGALWQARDAYHAATGWAPRHVGRELGDVRAAASQAGLNAIRARAEAHLARHHAQTATAGRHAALARSWTAIAAYYRTCETELDRTMTTRRAWEHATNPDRQLAVAADTELRRRHPRQHINPLRTAEPALTDTDHLHPAPGTTRYRLPDWINALAPERRAVHERLAQLTGDLSPSAGASKATGKWPSQSSLRQAAILQPPKPQIQPAHVTPNAGTQAEAR
jgi:hypothetical protein